MGKRSASRNGCNLLINHLKYYVSLVCVVQYEPSSLPFFSASLVCFPNDTEYGHVWVMLGRVVASLHDILTSPGSIWLALQGSRLPIPKELYFLLTQACVLVFQEPLWKLDKLIQVWYNYNYWQVVPRRVEVNRVDFHVSCNSLLMCCHSAAVRTMTVAALISLSRGSPRRG